MTKQIEGMTAREVDGMHRGREIIVELHPRRLAIRLKGTQQNASIDYEALVDFMLMRHAKAIAGGIPAARGRVRRKVGGADSPLAVIERIAGRVLNDEELAQILEAAPYAYEQRAASNES